MLEVSDNSERAATVPRYAVLNAYCVPLRVAVLAWLVQTEAPFFKEFTQESVYK